MLNLWNFRTDLSIIPNTKCAEVYFQTVDSFSIVCTFCEIKCFDFADFLQHFKNVHFDGVDTTQPPIKDEDVSQNPYQGNFEEKASLSPADKYVDSAKTAEVSAVVDTAVAPSPVVETLSADESFSNSDGNSKDNEYIPKILKRPTKSRPPARFDCSECSKSYKLPKSLDCHISKCHGTLKTLKCSRCDRVFSEERTLAKHERRDHTEYPCDQCDKTYNNRRALEYHKSKHTGELNFVCDFENCGKAFFHKKRLTAHKKYTHSQERKYVCEMCGFGLKSKQALDIHTRTHTGEKPFACGICDRKFASSSLLTEHKAMHLTERPHVCDVCSAAFARPKALYHHKHLHLGIKKFVCKVCGKAYAQAAGLCGHMRQHKAEQF